MDIDKLKKSVYNLTVKPVGREEELKIKDIPLGTDIIAKIEDKEAKIFFELNAEDIEDLEVSLNPSFIKRVQNTLRDYRNGKLKVGDWEGIFSGV